MQMFRTQVGIQVGCLFEFAPTVDRRTSDENNVVMIIKEHPMEDFMNIHTAFPKAFRQQESYHASTPSSHMTMLQRIPEFFS
jgi:hypothetical protein